MTLTITTQIKNITTPTTDEWGTSMQDFVKVFAPIVAIAVTVYVYTKDILRRPSIVFEYLFKSTVASDEITLHTSDNADVAKPRADETLPIANSEQVKTLRRRATRKRGLTEIRSLTA